MLTLLCIQFTTAVLSAALTLAAPAAGSVEIAYYPEHDCKGADHFATLDVDECYGPIFNFAESFKIKGGNLPAGYYIYGWSSPDCSGSSPVVQAFGPEDGKCYITGVEMGNVAEAQSFTLYKA